MTVDMRTGEIVPADHMATIEAMDPATQEVAVTNMLSEARSWLAHAMEATEPKTIATFKAQMATVAEATKQLNLSKEIQLDAQEMVRRGERGLELSIRDGQDAGVIKDGRSGGGTHAAGTVGSARRSDADRDDRPSPRDFFSGGSERSEAYQLGNATDDEFETAIGEAKSEGNLSRANVVRKVRSKNASFKRKQKAEAIAELAEQGYSSDQMVSKLDTSRETLRGIAREFGIEIPADKVIGVTRKIDHHRIVSQTVMDLEGTRMALELLDVTQIEDLSEVDYWVTSLTNSARALRKLTRRLSELARTKEMTQ